MENDKSSIGRKFRQLSRLGKKMTNSKEEMVKLFLTWLAEIYIPDITLEDGGRARGRFAGALSQLGVKVPERLIHDKTDVSGNFDAKSYSEGFREGVGQKINLNKVLIEIKASSRDRSERIQKIKEQRGLRGAMRTFIKELMEA